ncbi:protein of unknown function DUF1793 [Macrophomina phaseolina MS6]|uniref:Six-hairpin glycosidase-like protein n=1 Tax=Macrophomina phaseolina (strain MS6) TaxID=1126212 RepID=K2SNA6_MACPH|nr:protein of unknown function DUF1793 [Macrophomina phaseolina MS6]
MVSFAQHLRLLLASFLVVSSSAQTFSPITPPSFPLAVKNPYLSAWLPGNQSADLPSAQPEFWFANKLTWAIIARVDGSAYNLFGVPDPESGSQSATVVGGSFTSTHTIFTLTAGDATITLDFFSPVSPNNYRRQSMPFSFLTVTASGNDGATPSVQIYSDIDDSWTGQSASTTFTQNTAGDTTVYRIRNNNQVTYGELNEMAQWGYAVWGARADSHQSGSPSTVRGQFISNGTLTNATEAWSSGAVVGLAFDLGTVSTPSSAVYAIGYIRELAINYRGSPWTPYYRAYNPDWADAIDHFIDVHDDCVTESQALDSQVQSLGESTGGSNYTAILELSVRQIFGGIDVVIDNSTFDTSKPWAFIKEISSNGNLNTVDIIFPTFPFFYMFNAEYIKILLDPMMQYLEGGTYPQPYVIHDMGTHYPNATGHDDGLDEAMPVEQCGNLQVLALAYQTATGDTAWTTQYSALFKKYADYLVDNGLYPANQLSTNDGIGAFTNMTNLGVKAAVGLAAYGVLTSQSNYTDLGRSFADQIYGTNTSGDGLGTEISADTNASFFTLTYQDDTYFMVFNNYPDKLFNLSVFPDETYTALSEFYPTVRQPAGVALEGAIKWAKTDWQMWVAAVSEDSTQSMFVNDLYEYITNGKNAAPFPDRYFSDGDTVGRAGQGFRARPTLGGHFAIAALEKGVQAAA